MRVGGCAGRVVVYGADLRWVMGVLIFIVSLIIVVDSLLIFSYIIILYSIVLYHLFGPEPGFHLLQ